MASSNDADRVRRDAEEEILRFRVEKATAELQRAVAERNRLDAMIHDIAGTADGAGAVKKSMQLHREAMGRLREALRAFEEFDKRNRAR